jgi:hypothetical protein
VLSLNRAEMIEMLREMAGTPAEMAAAVGVEAQDRTFQRAVKALLEEGVLVAEGGTSTRRYRNAERVDTEAAQAPGLGGLREDGGAGREGRRNHRRGPEAEAHRG